VPALEMGGDGGRAGLVPVPVEVVADGDDLVLELVRGPGRAVQRPAGAGLQSDLASARNRWTSVITQRRETP
jgi:hypothetical protein